MEATRGLTHSSTSDAAASPTNTHLSAGMPLNTSPSTNNTGSTPQSSTMASTSSRMGDCFFAGTGMV